MHTLTYNLPNDIHTYIMTCNDENLEAFTMLLIDEGAYLIMQDNVTIYEGA